MNDKLEKHYFTILNELMNLALITSHTLCATREMLQKNDPVFSINNVQGKSIKMNEETFNT